MLAHNQAMAMKLLQRLDAHARTAGRRTAYRELNAEARELSYEQLRDRVFSFAGRLRGQVKAGEVVMLSLPNRIEYPVAFLSVLAAGCSVFPVSAEIAEVELRALARETGVAAIVGTERACAALKEQVPVVIGIAEVLATDRGATFEPGDASVDLLLCSSGTTARPKIVLRDAASLDAVSASMCAAVGFGEADRVLSIVPLCHSYGLEHGLLAPIWAGSTVHLCPGLDLGVIIPQLADGGITLFPSVPSAYDMMCQVGDGRALPALRKAYAAGAPLPKTIFDGFEAKFGVRIGQLYGATEIGSVTFSDPAAEHFDPRSVGVAYAGVRVRIADPQTRAELPSGAEGELLIAAPSMFRGYLHETTPSTVDGFFPTGDLGRVDEFGNLTITGRLKLLIEVGGLKVNVLEVEALLAQHPSVGEAAVVAIRVSETVSRLKAVVTPRNLDQPPVPEELRQFLRERLTAYKVPRVVEVRASLPRSPSGKILRRVLEAP
jgi:long-chain acyl-CoA synthetase